MGRRQAWNSMADLITMQQAADRLFDEAWGGRGLGWQQSDRTNLLPVDVYSTPDELVIQASVPGMDPERVEITIEGGTLTLRGESKPLLENVEYHIQERRHGAFARTLSLNVPVQADLAEAVFDQGVLTLTIPKAHEIRPRVIKVKSK